MNATRELLAVYAVLSGLIAAGAVAQDYTINWYTVDGGGTGPADASTGGNYTLSGTIGQADARNHPESMTGGTYSMTGGFWVIPECVAFAPADYDRDCDVDQADYQLFEACASGPDVPHAVDCGHADLDGNGDVDQDDFALFQRCVSGEGNPGDPDCAD